MHPQDVIEAEARRNANAFRMRTARRRFELERMLLTPSASFRAWARRTYNDFACAGKLARVVAGKRR